MLNAFYPSNGLCLPQSWVLTLWNPQNMLMAPLVQASIHERVVPWKKKTEGVNQLNRCELSHWLKFILLDLGLHIVCNWKKSFDAIHKKAVMIDSVHVWWWRLWWPVSALGVLVAGKQFEMMWWWASGLSAITHF